MCNLYRLSGSLYLIIIICGISAEVAFLGPLIRPGDPAGTQAALAAGLDMFRLGIAANMAMVLADIALAVTLFALFSPAAPTLAQLALVARLVQAAMIGAALMPLVGMTLIADRADSAALLEPLYDLYGIGYDLALVPFALSCLALAILFWTTRAAPRWIALGLGASAAVYAIGSALALLAPPFSPAFAMIYLVPLLAELGFAIWLLIQPAPVSKR